MARKTRLGQHGVGSEPYGGFSPKTPAAVGHNPGRITRLAQFGIGAERYAGFVAKTPAAGGGAGAHNPGRITRLAQFGIGARRYRANAFAGRVEEIIVVVVPPAPPLPLWDVSAMARQRKRREQDLEIVFLLLG